MTSINLKNVYIWFFVIYIAGSMGMFAVMLVPQESSTLDAGSTWQFMFVWVVLYLFTIVLSFVSWQGLPRRSYFFILLSFYMILSTLWSLQPSKTLMYSICFLMNLLFVIFAIRHFSKTQMFDLILSVLFWMTTASIFLSIVGLDSVKYIDIHDRETFFGDQPYRGLFNHKITAGLYTAFGFTLSFILKRGFVRVTYLSVFLIFNLMTGSATGLSMLVIGLFSYLLLSFCINLNFSSKAFINFFVAFVLSGLIVFTLWGSEILELLGRDPTLTGRTLLWAWGLEAFAEQPFLGWGYFGYNGSSVAGNIAQTYVAFTNYEVPHFHNSYIQMLVDLGGVVGGTLIFSYIHTLYLSYNLALTSKNDLYRRYDLCSTIIVILLLICSFFILVIGRYNDFSFLLFMLVFFIARGGER